MEKRGFKNKILVYLVLVLTSLISFTTALTTAAYIIIENHSQNITIDLSYSKYFGGGTGTEADPYLIKTPAQLRNLSYLVNSGFLGKNHYIKIANDITWGSEAPLIPIGTDQSPFISHLSGTVSATDQKVVSVIHGLRVEGDNLADVGMFGFIGNSGHVENFVLDSPVIISKGISYTREQSDLNPIRKLTNGGKIVFSEANIASSITLNPTAYSDKKTTQYASEFNITYPLKDSSLLTYDLGNVTQQAVIGVDVSDESFFSSIDKSVDGKVSLVCNDALIAPTLPNSTKKAEGKLLTISLYVHALCKTDNGNRFAKMTLERYKVYYNYAQHGIVAIPGDSRNYGKTIYPPIEYDEKTVEDQRVLVTYDDSKALYVGVVAGTLNGSVYHIGVHNPILDMKRPFVSNSLLFGRVIDDDNKRTITKDEMCNLSAIGQNNVQMVRAPKRLNNFVRRGTRGVANADFETQNSYVANIYRHAYDDSNPNFTPDENNTPFSKTGGFEFTTQNVLKIYDKYNRKQQDNDVILQDEVDVYSEGESYFKGDSVAGVTSTKVNAITLASPKKTLMSNSRFYTDINGNDVHVGYDTCQVSNAINLWTTAKHDRGRAKKLSNGALDFYLEVSIDYLYFDDADIDPNIGGYHELEVDVIDRGIGRRRVGGNKATNGKSTHFRYPHLVAQKGTVSTRTSELDDVPFQNKAPGIDPKAVDANGKPLVYPFAYIKENSLGENPLILKEKHGNVTGRSATAKYKVSTLTFSISANGLYQRPSNVKDEIHTAFFPSFYIGFKQRSNNSKFYFDILGMSIIMSNKRGNTESSTGTVDFINSSLTLPITSNGKGWNSSGAKIYAKTILNEQENKLNSGDKPETMTFDRFACVHPKLVNGSTYKVSDYYINVIRSGSTVNCKYNIVGINNDTQSAEYAEYFQTQRAVGFPKPTVTFDSTYKPI